MRVRRALWGAKLEAALPLLPVSALQIEEQGPGDQHFVLKSHDGKPVRNRRYRVSTGNETFDGFTDESGKTTLLEGAVRQDARFELISAEFDEHFVLKDPLGPIVNMRYRIRAKDGSFIEGISDHKGRTALFVSDQAEEVTLFIVKDDDCLNTLNASQDKLRLQAAQGEGHTLATDGMQQQKKGTAWTDHGVLLYNEADYAAARTSFEKGASQDVPIAFYYLGQMAMDGKGYAVRDQAVALKYYERAALLGLEHARRPAIDL